jgi:hypothetical protein
MKKTIKPLLTLSLLVMVGGVWGQGISPEQDSLLQYLVKNQADLKSVVENYQSVTFNWGKLLSTLAGFFVLAGLTWKLWAEDWIKNHIKAKAQEAVESMANLKGAKILVLTSANGSDAFLRDFFKAKKFPNVHFERIGDAFQTVSNFDYEMVFANNDDGKLNQDIVRQHFRTDNVLFYFGKERWDTSKDSPELSRSLNMANSRAQIYGNLMSSLEFLELVQPKIKNV